MARSRGEHRRTAFANAVRLAASARQKVQAKINEAVVEVAAEEIRVNLHEARPVVPAADCAVSPAPASQAASQAGTVVLGAGRTVSPARAVRQGASHAASPSRAPRSLSPVPALAMARSNGVPPPLPALGPMPVSFQASVAPVACSGIGRSYRVLCYGDSLTAGFCVEGRQYEPYGRALAETLGAAGLAACEVAVCGHSGHTAAEMVVNQDAAAVEDIGGMVGKGLRRILEEEPTPDLVLLMAGTNDIGREAHPQTILDDICRLHAMCHACGVRTVALAPPPAPRAAAGSSWETRRRQLSGLLAKWARGGRAAGVAALVDPGELVPSAMGSSLWDLDGLHLSPSGSRLLGQRLAQLVGPLLPKAVPEPSPVRAARGARVQAAPRASSPHCAPKVVPTAAPRSVQLPIAGSTAAECANM